MAELRTKRLLRECIKEMLAEDLSSAGDYGGLGLGMGSGDMPYGAAFGSSEQMYNVFVKPFTDVVKTAAGKTKEMSQKSQTLLSVAFEAAATSLIPWLSSDYNEIFAKEKQEIDKIRSEYGDVYKANWDAFKDNDIMIAAFAYRPDLFLTAAMAKKTPKVAAKLLSVLSGGSLDRVLGKLLRSASGGSRRGPDGPGVPMEGHLREEDTEGQVKDPSPLERLVANSKVKDLLANSPRVQQMSHVGQNLVQGTLRSVFSQAQNVMSARSLGDLQRKVGKKLPGLDKIDQVPEEERQKAEEQLVAGVKQGMKAFYLKSLETHVKEAVEAGVPKEHPFVQDYLRVISKIKAL